MNLRNVIVGLIIFAIALTPVFGLLETISLFRNLKVSLTEAQTPVYIKVLKDFIFFVITLLVAFRFFLKRQIPNISPSYYLFLLLIFLYASLFILKSPIEVATGLRACFPFIGYVIGYNVEKEDLKRISLTIYWLFLFELIVQCFEFVIISYAGKSSFGFSLRNPGTFLVPSTMAAFSMVAAATILKFAEFNDQKKRMLIAMTFVSVALTASGTGILCMMAIGVLYMLRNVRPLYLLVPALCLVAITILLALPTISGREDIWTSLAERLAQLYGVQSWRQSLYGMGFGSATNGGVLLVNLAAVDQPFNQRIADSTVTFFMYNFGLIGVFAFYVFLLEHILPSWRENWLFWSIILIFSLTTTIFFEAYPMNWIIFIIIGFLGKQKMTTKNIVPVL